MQVSLIPEGNLELPRVENCKVGPFKILEVRKGATLIYLGDLARACVQILMGPCAVHAKTPWAVKGS